MPNPIFVPVGDQQYCRLLEYARAAKKHGLVEEVTFDLMQQQLPKSETRFWVLGYVKLDEYGNLLVQIVFHDGDNETFVPVIPSGDTQSGMHTKV